MSAQLIATTTTNNCGSLQLVRVITQHLAQMRVGWARRAIAALCSVSRTVLHVVVENNLRDDEEYAPEYNMWIMRKFMNTWPKQRVNRYMEWCAWFKQHEFAMAMGQELCTTPTTLPVMQQYYRSNAPFIPKYANHHLEFAAQAISREGCRACVCRHMYKGTPSNLMYMIDDRATQWEALGKMHKDRCCKSARGASSPVQHDAHCIWPTVVSRRQEYQFLKCTEFVVNHAGVVVDCLMKVGLGCLSRDNISLERPVPVISNYIREATDAANQCSAALHARDWNTVAAMCTRPDSTLR